MHRVGGDTLGGMDSAGIDEARGVLDVVGGQPDAEPAAAMSDGQVALAADCGDGPAIAVFYPVSGGEAESPVVAAVMITSPTLAWLPSANRTAASGTSPLS